MYLEDCYRLKELVKRLPCDSMVACDIGSHAGSFANAWHELRPQDSIACVEACPENIDVLMLNLEAIDAQAVAHHAACSYEPGPLVLLNSIMPDDSGTATGGSRAITREEAQAGEGTWGHSFYADPRPVEKVTLEEVVFPEIEISVLKLDCEGGEYSILENSPSLDRVNVICGEYHGNERWRALVSSERFRDWRYRLVSRRTDKELGVFHLINPRLGPL